ncbi:hypothetical protein EYF80_012911 [Liparis tanakae]|uniref:Uncharacterized protein n=1 Tax=Liparis tanakae TaxID=230148 RepID=A0A4Z2IFX3_9TELE|nr:hypothetical protein EYF80_012911 [Liparis tanakae]
MSSRKCSVAPRVPFMRSSWFIRVKYVRALTHSLCDALNELGYQFLSGGNEGLLLAQTLQLPLLGLQSTVTVQQLVQGGCEVLGLLQMEEVLLLLPLLVVLVEAPPFLSATQTTR